MSDEDIRAAATMPTQPPENAELAACPFCADPNRYFTWVTNASDSLEPMVAPQCDHCGASGPFYATEAEAITAWNTRPSLSPPVLPGVREARGSDEARRAIKDALSAYQRECDEFIRHPGTAADALIARLRSILNSPDEAAVERAARAMCVEGGFDPDEIMSNDGPRWRYYVPGCRAALTAALGVAAPDGGRS